MTTEEEKKLEAPAAAPAVTTSTASEKRKRKREKEKENKRTKPKIEKPAAAESSVDKKPTSDKKNGDKKQKNGKPNKDGKPKLGKDKKPLRPKKPKKERDPNAPKKGPAVAKPPPPDTLDEAVAHMTPSLAVDHIAQKLRHFEKDISAVELEDRLIKRTLPHPAAVLQHLLTRSRDRILGYLRLQWRADIGCYAGVR